MEGRMTWLERHQWLTFAAALLVLAAVLALRPASDTSPAQIVISDSAPPADGVPIRVHVTGAVQRPGVVPLRSGDRLSDALAAAGGASGSADVEDLNLARRLRDGEQVVIPEKTRRTATTAAPFPAQPPGVKLDLNRATEAQLDALPGIGATYAKRIVDSRAVDGPFKNAQDLVARRIVPQTTFDKMRDLVVVTP
jgi:competence protein ComEA